MVMCEIRSFPALGFDPTPGNAGAIQEVMGKLATAQVTLSECATRMSDALDVSDDWDGDAADDFHDNGDDLPKAFSSGATSMGNAAKALSVWYGQLTGNQQTTELLEKQAKEAKQLVAAAEVGQQELGKQAAAASGDDKLPALEAYGKAVLVTMAAKSKLEGIINRAKALQKRHLAQANQAAENVKSDDDGSFQPQNDNWVVQVTDTVSKTSGIVSTVSGTIAAASLVVPVAGEVVAPVAGTVAAASGGIHTVAAIGQKGLGSSNAPSAAEIVIGAVPTKAVTAPAGAVGKEILKDGERVGLKQGLKQAGKDTADATDFGKAYKGVKDIRAARGSDVGARAEVKEARRKALEDKGKGLSKVLPGTTRRDYEGLGRARSGAEAASGAVSSADKIDQALDPDDKRTPAEKRTINAAKVLLNPSTDSFLNWGKSEAIDMLKNAGKK
jgi:hypothetical protein